MVAGCTWTLKRPLLSRSLLVSPKMRLPRREFNLEFPFRVGEVQDASSFIGYDAATRYGVFFWRRIFGGVVFWRAPLRVFAGNPKENPRKRVMLDPGPSAETCRATHFGWCLIEFPTA